MGRLLHTLIQLFFKIVSFKGKSLFGDHFKCLKVSQMIFGNLIFWQLVFFESI